MQSLRVTLYEIFGYIVPGFIAVIAISIGVWGIYCPSVPLVLQVPTYNVVEFGFVAFVAYMAGHILQAVGNFFPRAESRRKLCKDCDNLLKSAIANLHQQYGVTEPKPSMKDAVSLAQAILSQDGNVNDYEVFVYREGFYRGAAISMFLCGIALLIRARDTTFLIIGVKIFEMPLSLLYLLAFSAFATAFLFYLRYCRFGEYRIRHVLSVIAVVKSSEIANQEKKEK